MIQLQMLWAWAEARVGKIRDEENKDAGFTTLEWVAIAAVVIIAAIAIATVLMNKARTGADGINVQ